MENNFDSMIYKLKYFIRKILWPQKKFHYTIMLIIY
jgi:hypothetical protein